MRRVADALLWVGAVLGALSLVAAVLVTVLGIVPLIFTSGSMSPGIPTGSLGVARSVPAADLAVRDVVSVESAEGVRVTHRIAAIEETADATLLTLKGDANSEPDAEPYRVTEADRLMFSVPWVGYVLSAMSNPVVLFGAGVLAAGVLFAVVSSVRRSGGSRRGGAEAAAGGRRRRDGSADRPRGAARTVAGLLAVALPTLLALQPVQPTMAAFTDLGATVTTTGFVGHRVGQPIDITCSANLLQLTVGTTVHDPRYTYWAQAFTVGTSGTAISNPKQMTGTGTTRSTTFGTVSDFLIQPIVGSNYEMRVYARVSGTTWQSQEYRVQRFSRTLTLMTCGVAPTVPTIDFAEPVNGGRHGFIVTASRLSSVCGSAYGSTAAAACGTVSDDGSIASVEYILQRTGFLLGTRCWDGTAWVISCAYRTASRNTSTNPQRWSVPRTNDPYTAYADYALTIRATDNEGHATTRTIYYSVALI